MRFARIFTLALNVLAAAGLCLTVFAFFGSWIWYADLFSHFRPQFAVYFASLAALLGILRQRVGVIVSVFGLLINAVVLFLHQTSGVLEIGNHGGRQHALRCVSINVLQGNANHDELLRFVRESNADFILFQEVNPRWCTALKTLADVYPHQFFRARKDSRGTAFLSRRMVRKMSFDPVSGDEEIGAMRAELETTQGKVITILGVHSHKPTSAEGARGQREYFRWLTGDVLKIALQNGPIILMGDFNATPWSSAFREFSSRSNLYDTSLGHAFDATWNAGRPHRLLIDHAFVPKEWRVFKRSVGPDVGSDHRPLILDLEVAAGWE